jgi:hypothetical protein
MTTTRAILKTPVQCRPMWFWHLIGGTLCLIALIRPLTFTGAREGIVFGVLAVPLWNGVILASLWKEFLSKPFSFDLPRHQLAWRRTLFAIALVVAGVCALVTSFVPADSPEAVAVRVWQTFFLSMGMFMVGVLATTSLSNTTFLPGLITVLFFISLDESLTYHLRVLIDRVLLANTVLTTGACTIVVAAAWRVLGSRRLVRSICGEAFLPLQSMWNSERQAAYAKERKLRRLQRPIGGTMKALERFALTRMRRLSGHPTLRSLWGTLYVQVGKVAPVRAANLIALCLLLLVATVVAGFYGPGRQHPEVSVANLIILVVCGINADYRVNPHAALLLNVSRKNRFRSLMFSALSQWLVVAIVAAALTAISIASGRYLDEVTIYGIVYTYTPIHPMAFFFFAPMLPFVFLSQVVFPRQHVIAIVVISVIVSIFFVSSAHRVLEAPVLGLLVLQVVSWLPFVAFIRHYCYSWDLKLNGQ